MRQPGPHLVGRDEQLAALAGLLDGRFPLPATLVLAGEAGIGKTTLWLAGRATAAERGFRILSTRTSEAETRFSFGRPPICSRTSSMMFCRSYHRSAASARGGIAARGVGCPRR